MVHGREHGQVQRSSYCASSTCLSPACVSLLPRATLPACLSSQLLLKAGCHLPTSACRLKTVSLASALGWESVCVW